MCLKGGEFILEAWSCPGCSCWFSLSPLWPWPLLIMQAVVLVCPRCLSCSWLIARVCSDVAGLQGIRPERLTVKPHLPHLSPQTLSVRLTLRVERIVGNKWHAPLHLWILTILLQGSGRCSRADGPGCPSAVEGRLTGPLTDCAQSEVKGASLIVSFYQLWFEKCLFGFFYL